MSPVEDLSRRSFFKVGITGSALVLGVRDTGGAHPFAYIMGEPDATEFEPNVYISIDEAGAVTLTVHRSEMGQGVRTACAMMLADELDVAWEDVTVTQAIGHPRYGNQNTDGSRTVRTQWEPLRQAGAAAREMLVAAAAASWQVSASDCRTEASHVVHTGTGRRLRYAELAARAAEMPVPESPRLKSKADFTLIGTPTRIVDGDDITRGKAIYGWDVTVPNMVYASLERSPTVHGRARRYDAEAAKAVPGVLDVVELDGHSSGISNRSIAVIAENTWATFKGREALRAEWSSGSEPIENSEEYREKLAAVCGRPGRVIREEGLLEEAERQADKVLEAEYHAPYLVHAPMEPPTCTAWVHDGQCEVWAPTQAPQWARRDIASTLGIDAENVTVNVTLLGGGFGRKSKPDFILEAVSLAEKIGRPVKVAWKREDEIRHGFYRAESMQRVKMTIADGQPTGWFHRTVFPTIGWSFDPTDLGPSGGELGQGFTNMPYRFPNIRLEAGSIMSSQRIGWWRSVCNTFHAFAVQSSMDELAHELGRDPVEFQLEMLGEARMLALTERDRQSPYPFDTGRLSRVVETAARMADWGRTLPDGEGMGFACHHSFLSYIAMALHASIQNNGFVRVHDVYCAVDCGQYVNPDTIKAQMEGAVVFGLTAAYYGEITVQNSAIVQGNFNDYRMLRIGDAPTVHVELIEGDERPTGIGEPGVPPVAPALANAIFAATGTRIRDLPLTRHGMA